MRATLSNTLALFAALAPTVLWAAEVWDSKPFQDWTQKDVLKIFNNSPWARQARAVIGVQRQRREEAHNQPLAMHRRTIRACPRDASLVGRAHGQRP